ncbi:MAG: V-type ATP synthase subunit I [Clostridia bacterium]|nr:V-type ATP synthase subunit I [Clostridia bacterium]
MAKINMKYIEIAAPVSESKALFDYLQMCSVMELKEAEEVEGFEKISTDSTVNKISKYYDTATSALKIIDKYAPEKSSMLAGLKGLPEMTMSEYLAKSETADDVLATCLDICADEKKIAENKAAIARNEAGRDAVEPWLPLDVSMKYQGTETTQVYIGTVPGDYTAESLITAMVPFLDGEERVECEVVSHQKDRSCVFVVCHRECSDITLQALRSLGFAYPADPTKHPPKVRYERLGSQNEKLKAEIEEAEAEIKSLAAQREDIKFAVDYFAIRRSKYEALDKILTGGNVIILTGYVPENKADKLVKNLEEKFTVAYTVTDPAEDEEAPVMFENKPFVAAVEPITAMYAMPGKKDIDPNPVMAAFYYLLFGIMLSDAGYGMLMAIGCGIAKFGLKVKGKMKKTVDMYFWCGLATVFWGTLFGSWFGDLPNVIWQQFLDHPDPINLFGKGGVALWFEPVSDPMKLLIFSFLFGIIHLFAGVVLSFVTMWKNNNKIGAICDCIPIFILIIGVCPLGYGILNSSASETIAGWAIISKVGTYMLLAGAILVVLTAGRDSKNIVGKLGLGLYGLYNAASGWLGDILSYSRLLALGLCTGVIASVVNTLGCIPSNKTVKLILFVFVFIFGHVVNMAINLIGTYVHTNRLQYVEFFGKFYEGGGKNFTPLATNTKYFNVKEDK